MYEDPATSMVSFCAQPEMFFVWQGYVINNLGLRGELPDGTNDAIVSGTVVIQ